METCSFFAFIFWKEYLTYILCPKIQDHYQKGRGQRKQGTKLRKSLQKQKVKTPDNVYLSNSPQVTQKTDYLRNILLVFYLKFQILFIFYLSFVMNITNVLSFPKYSIPVKRTGTTSNIHLCQNVMCSEKQTYKTFSFVCLLHFGAYRFLGGNDEIQSKVYISNVWQIILRKFGQCMNVMQSSPFTEFKRRFLPCQRFC